MIDVEIVGGPHDGKRIAMPDVRALRIPIMMNPPHFVAETIDEVRPITVRYVEMMPQLTSNGWRLYWREPSC